MRREGGTLALGVALGIGGMATDQSGSLVILTRGPWGRMLLVAVALGLGAYAIWGFVRAIFDPLHRGDDPPGIAERLGFAWSGTAYTAMVLLAPTSSDMPWRLPEKVITDGTPALAAAGMFLRNACSMAA